MSARQQRILEKMLAEFTLSHIDVADESSGHNVPAGAESHFKVIIVTDSFEEMPVVKRHQAVYDTLSMELKSHVHALSLFTYSKEEWESIRSVPDSPKCMGG